MVRSGFVQAGGYGAIPAMRRVLAANGRDVQSDCLRKRLELHGDLLATEPGEISRRLPGGDAEARGTDYEVRSVAVTAVTTCCAWMGMVDALDGRRTHYVSPWPWSQVVRTAGDAVQVLRTRLWPAIPARDVYAMVHTGSLALHTMPSSLVTATIRLHWQCALEITDTSSSTAQSDTLVADPGTVTTTPLKK